ncbi:MAG: Uncharacterised protein [Flavobacterium sp. SCGC AAA160-P02]|nr:MAG: Uncharacterised protein [Flavobacterium sp. SCGC AAA160-P02]
MIKTFLKILCIVSVSFLFSCQEIQLSAKQILSRSIEAHGGLSNWEQVDSISFHKKTTLYTREGLKEKEINQHQAFYLGDGFNGRIFSYGDPQIVYSLKDGEYAMTKGDSSIILNDVKKQSLKTMFNSAYYVISQPFHLKESNANLILKKDTVINDRKTYVLDISYLGDTSTSDNWTYFFDAETFLITSCRVKHKTTVSYIKNLVYDTNTPFVFNAERESVFLNNDGTKDYVRASYLYSDYRVVLKSNL